VAARATCGGGGSEYNSAVTKRRVDVVWDGAPAPELRHAVEHAIQRGAIAGGYLGSVRVRLGPDGKVEVTGAKFSSFADPWRGEFDEPETARRWLAAGLGPELVR
jgi:hypothetical protein